MLDDGQRPAEEGTHPFHPRTGLSTIRQYRPESYRTKRPVEAARLGHPRDPECLL